MSENSGSTLEGKLRRAWPPERWQDVTVVVGVSGGADSTALARALTRIRNAGIGRLVVAHFHHGLRGAAADDDAQCVADLARTWHLPCEIGFAEQSAPRSASEEELRDARWQFLNATARAYGARYVAVAHTADDQVETILHRILRGTGLPGLAGIPRTRQLSPATTLIRPLLNVTRQEVLDYLAFHQQPYRTDDSNQDRKYLRNRLRNELIPLLERDFNPQVREALKRLGELASDARELIEHHSDQLLDRWLTDASPDAVELQVPVPMTEPKSALQACLVRLWSRQNWPAQAMTADHWERLAALFTVPPSGSNSLDLPDGIRAERTQNALTLRRST